MSEVQTELEDRSLLEGCQWLLFEQYEDTQADQLRSAFVFIGLGTSFLSFVSAVSALMVSVQLWPSVLLLTGLGIATLVFAWLLAIGRFGGLFSDSETSMDADASVDADTSMDSDGE